MFGLGLTLLIGLLTTGSGIAVLVWALTMPMSRATYVTCAVDRHEAIDGQSLRPLLSGEGAWKPRSIDRS